MPTATFRRLIATMFLAALAMMLGPSGLRAACHTVSVAGSGTQSGADWNNTMSEAMLDSLILIRGDSYYMRSGTYGPHDFRTPDSGTTQIFINAATVANHCTNTGFNAATMAVDGGGGPVNFNTSSFGISFQTDYWTLSGQVRSSLNSGYGMKLDDSRCSGTTICYPIQVYPGGNITVQYVEIAGNKATCNISGTIPNCAEQPIRIFHGAGNDTLQYMWVHDSSQDFILTETTNNVTFKYSFFDTNNSSASTHGQCMEDQGSNNYTFAYNIWARYVGTGCIGALQRAGNATSDSWVITGNVFYYDASSDAGDGAIYCINAGITCSNWKITNNTVAGTGTQQCGFVVSGASSSGALTRNNLFYNCGTTSPGFSGVEDHNTLLNIAANGGFNNSTDFSITGATNPFVNVSAILGNYRLTSETVDAHVNDGTSAGLTSSPYNVDADGNQRAISHWNRGAYQFISLTTGPNPPQNLVLTSVQ